MTSKTGSKETFKFSFSFRGQKEKKRKSRPNQTCQITWWLPGFIFERCYATATSRCKHDDNLWRGLIKKMRSQQTMAAFLFADLNVYWRYRLRRIERKQLSAIGRNTITGNVGEMSWLLSFYFGIHRAEPLQRSDRWRDERSRGHAVSDDSISFPSLPISLQLSTDKHVGMTLKRTSWDRQQDPRPWHTVY